MLGRVRRRFFAPVDRSSSPITLRVGVRPRNTKPNWIFLLLPATRYLLLLQNIIIYKWYKRYFVDASLSLCLSVSLFLSLSLRIFLSISFSFSLIHSLIIVVLHTVVSPQSKTPTAANEFDVQSPQNRLANTLLRRLCRNV